MRVFSSQDRPIATFPGDGMCDGIDWQVGTGIPTIGQTICIDYEFGISVVCSINCPRIMRGMRVEMFVRIENTGQLDGP